MKSSLAEKFPELAAQWHPTLNGDLTPDQVSAYSDTVVWWSYPYTDPSTGKRFHFLWNCKIKTRSRKGAACPYISGKAVWTGFNDLATKFPELADQWDYENNGSFTPQNIYWASRYKASWVYPYSDPDTGKQFVFRWQARINDRISKGTGCPYLSGKAVWIGFNDLATKAPQLVEQWDYDHNGRNTPQNVTLCSNYRASWIYPYYDPDTGKHFVFRWRARVNERSTKGHGCPYLSGKAVWTGFNDLATKVPELADQWDYENNGSFTPQNIYWASKYRASWIYPYYDPDTGKQFTFRWKARVIERSAKGTGCPYLSGKAVWTGFNDLATKYPELATQWDYENNGSFTPQNVYWASTYRASWVYPYSDPDTGRHFVFRWKARVNDRTSKGSGCPYLSGNAVWTGFNDLATKFQELADQWDYENNGSFTPQNVSWASTYRASWVYPYTDPDTGKHFVFRWKASIGNRTCNKTGCPYLSGQAVWTGFNDLATKYPELADQWDYENNGSFTPQNVSWASKYRASWIYPYYDPDTGKQFTFHWKSRVVERSAKGHGCPYLSGKAVWTGFNDLATKYPELADQWDYENNGSFTPQNIYWASTYRASWVYPYTDPDTGKHFVFRWKARINERTNKGSGCPYLSGRAVWIGFNDVATKAPELAKQWDYERNHPLTPKMVTVSSNKYVAWTRDYHDPFTGLNFKFKWISNISRRKSDGSDCPYLSNTAIWPGYNDLMACFPEIAKEWDYKKNIKTPSQVYKLSQTKYYWICSVCGKEFFTTVYNRVKLGNGCKYCVDTLLQCQ